MKTLKDIPGYEKLYAITDDGQVWSYGNRIGSSSSGKFISQCGLNHKYLRVALFKNKKRKNWLVHQLVVMTYIGPVNKLTVNHIDGNKLNNQLKNLEIISRSENTKHGWKNGLIKTRYGEKNGNVKLKKHQVLSIKKLRGQKSQRELAKMFEVSQGTIYKVQKNKTWVNI